MYRLSIRTIHTCTNLYIHIGQLQMLKLYGASHTSSHRRNTVRPLSQYSWRGVFLHASSLCSNVQTSRKSSHHVDDGHKLSSVGVEDSPRGLTAMFTEEQPTVCPFDGVYKAWN